MMKTAKEALEWVKGETERLRQAYNMLMGDDKDEQFDGIRRVKSVLEHLQSMVEYELETLPSLDKGTRIGERARAASKEGEVEKEPEESSNPDLPPVPPPKPMPKVERYRAKPMRMINHKPIYKEMCEHIFESMKPGLSEITTKYLANLIRNNTGLTPKTASDYATSYVTHFRETGAFEIYKENRKSHARYYRFTGKTEATLNWTPDAKPSPPPEEPIRPKLSNVRDETPVHIMNKYKIFESRCRLIRQKLFKGDTINTMDFKKVLVNIGYTKKTAELYSNPYRCYLVHDGTLLDLGVNPIGVKMYKVQKGMLRVESSYMTPAEAARRAEEERRTHSDVMGGPH